MRKDAHYLEARIVPALGPKRWLSEIHSKELLELVRGATKDDGTPLSGAAKADLAGVLKRFFKWAVREQYLRANPASELPSSYGGRSSRRANIQPNLADIERLATAMDTHWPTGGHTQRGGDLVWLLALTGCRWEEAVALERDDVDLTAHRLHIRRTASESWGQREIRDDAKSEASFRKIVVVDQLVPLLEKLLELEERRRAAWEETKEQLLATEQWRQSKGKPPSVCKDGHEGCPLPKRHADRDRRLLITGAHGGFAAYSVWRKALARAREETGVDLTAHEQRHVHASLLIASGARPHEIAASIGHRDSGYTERIYGHLFNDDLDALRQRVSRYIAQRR